MADKKSRKITATEDLKIFQAVTPRNHFFQKKPDVLKTENYIQQIRDQRITGKCFAQNHKRNHQKLFAPVKLKNSDFERLQISNVCPLVSHAETPSQTPQTSILQD